MLFGRRSEKLFAEELTQLARAFGSSEESAQSADPTLPAGKAPTEIGIDDGDKTKKKRKHRGRTKLSPSLERIITDVPVPDEERACQQCDCEMTSIGHLEHERVEYVPAQLVVHVERREKLACKPCRCDATTAERQDTRDVSRRVGASFLAQLIESKCDDALPIYRQRDQMKRLGCDIPLNTLYSYWSHATDLKVVPTSPLGRALGYAEHQRAFVRRCFEDGRFEIDNGHTERQIRGPAIGRKNYLFTGSAKAAKRLAGAYTLVQSCRNLGFGAREYLIDVLKKLEAGWPARRVRELVPDRWAELHRLAVAADNG